MTPYSNSPFATLTEDRGHEPLMGICTSAAALMGCRLTSYESGKQALCYYHRKTVGTHGPIHLVSASVLRG